ncbi:MAG: L,D-transpeptidase family protein [Gammaproteobacteria bacterium]
MANKISIEIDLSSQQMTVFLPDDEILCYPISSAKNGAGEQLDSECTPRGIHRIAEKIGDGEAENTVFVGRKPTGEIYSEEFAKEQPVRDWILTRILWLDGCEAGKNQGGAVDSKKRYIYIHGTPDTTPLRTPGSRGCIRMANKDIIEVFEKVEVGTMVEIID